LANPSADRVLLLIQRFLLLFGDMAPVLARHVPFLLANLMILMVQLLRLTFGDFALFAFPVDAEVLVFQPAVNLDATRMVFRPWACEGTRGQSNCEARGEDDTGKNSADFAVHDLTPSIPSELNTINGRS
jgi:hypothetical protein